MKSLNQKYKTILVTGGAGAIGSNLVKELLDMDVKKIIVIDNLISGFRENLPQDSRLIFIKGDIVDDKDLARCFKEKPEAVFHLAASFANERSINDPIRDLTTNAAGTIKLLKKGVQYKVKKFIYFSSSCVYGDKNRPLKEKDVELCPGAPYAISKLAGEYYVKFYCEFYGLPTVILRIFNSFGPGEHPGKYRNVVPNFFWRAINNQSLVITGTGKEMRAFTYVKDVVRGAILAVLKEKAVNKIINLGLNKEITILELARLINQITGNQAEIKFKQRRNWDKIKRRKPDTKLAEEILGFYPQTSLKEGLERTYQWFQKIKFHFKQDESKKRNA